MDLAGMNSLATDQNFQKRVFAGAVKVAREIIESGPPANNAEVASLQLALTVFADAMADSARLQARSYAASVVTDLQVQAERDAGSSQASVTDATILQALRDAWTMLAGQQPVTV